MVDPRVMSTLGEHPAIAEVVVVDGADPAHPRSTAYIVLRKSEGGEPAEVPAPGRNPMGMWRTLFDMTYRQAPPSGDAAFNFTGWKSSYTGKILAEEDMAEWRDTTLRALVSERPRRVLEIGCGTGMLLFGLAPMCEKYHATDLSKVAIEKVGAEAERRGLSQVQLFAREATDFSGWKPAEFDLVILNSVVQFFPDGEYLSRVLEGAAELTGEGGSLFVGDVRSLPLLVAFHLSVVLGRASGELPAPALRDEVSRQLHREGELAVDPAFFAALPHRIPRIRGARLELARGLRDNEMTRFRYSARLAIGGPVVSSASDAIRLAWGDGVRDLDDMERILKDHDASELRVTDIPNARIAVDVAAVELLDAPGGPGTAAELRRAATEAGSAAGAIHPEELLKLGSDTGHNTWVGWSGSGADGSMEAVFRRGPGAPDRIGDFPLGAGAAIPSREWTNDPRRTMMTRDLVTRLKRFLEERLPGAQVPESFVVLETLPRDPVGAVSLSRLPGSPTWRQR